MTLVIRQHLQARWGDEAVWVVRVTDAAGAPVNITGAAMRFTAKLRAGDPDGAAILSKTVGAGISLSAPTAGEATVTLADTDTTTRLAPGRTHRLLYDWRMTLAGQTTTVAHGDLLIEPAMSRVV
ncbi:MAG TPA: hypothetical protein VLM76_11695 [Patescibacteria group bacterium]|nr:hypothetical protein [Patescibacteria group bacterium]